MLIELNIQLTTNLLGSGPRVNGVRKLKRSPDNRIVVNEKEWKEDLKSTAKSIELDFDVECISFEPGFEFPEVNVLRRVYNKTNVDLFEGISAGNNISIYFLLNDVDVGLNNLKTLFDTFGKFFGISQFGKKFHCGRFKVIGLTKLTKDDL